MEYLGGEHELKSTNTTASITFRSADIFNMREGHYESLRLTSQANDLGKEKDIKDQMISNLR